MPTEEIKEKNQRAARGVTQTQKTIVIVTNDPKKSKISNNGILIIN